MFHQRIRRERLEQLCQGPLMDDSSGLEFEHLVVVLEHRFV